MIYEKEEVIGLSLFTLGLLMLAHNPIISITGNVVLANAIHANLWFYLFSVCLSFAGLILILAGRVNTPLQYTYLEELVRNKKYDNIKRDVPLFSLVPDTGRKHKEHLSGGASNSQYLPDYNEEEIQKFEKRVIREGRGEIHNDELVFYGLSDKGSTGTIGGVEVNAIKVIVKQSRDKYGRKRLHYYGEPLRSTDIPASVRNIKGMPLADLYDSMKKAGYNLSPKVKGDNEIERFDKSKSGTAPKTHETQFEDDEGRLWSIDRSHIPPHFDRMDETEGIYDIVSSTGEVIHTKPSRKKRR